MLADLPEAFALGGDCASSGPEGDWDNPETFGSVSFPSGIIGKDIDVILHGEKRYALLATEHADIAKSDLWIIDVTDPPNPVTLSNLDLGLLGLNAVDAARDNATGKIYVYAASNDDADAFQLQVIEITDPNNPNLVASRTLPGVSGACPFTCPGGRSIFYYNNYIYIGTHRLLVASPRHELHVYNAQNPASPVWVGSIKIDHNINDIIVTGDTAYLATSSDTEEIIVVDFKDKASPKQVGAFDAKRVDGGPSDEDGTELFLIGNKLYLGRERVTNPNERDFYILDLNTFSILGSKRLGISPNTEVSGIAIAGNFAFVATTDPARGFQVWNIANPQDIKPQSACGTYNFSAGAAGIDFRDNFGFISAQSETALRIIYDKPDICS